MTRYLTNRQPKKSRVAYARIASDDGVLYRLFRKDENGALHILDVHAHPGDDPCMTARDLRIAKRKLRDLVDEIDLQRMGVGA